MERVHVEMIEMRMGKKDDIDRGEVANGKRGGSQAFGPEGKTGQPDSDPRKKNGIGENLCPEKIDQHRCVPEPCAVIRLSLPSAGSGRAKAGAIGRRLSTRQSCQG